MLPSNFPTTLENNSLSRSPFFLPQIVVGARSAAYGRAIAFFTPRSDVASATLRERPTNNPSATSATTSAANLTHRNLQPVLYNQTGRMPVLRRYYERSRSVADATSPVWLEWGKQRGY